ncbi:hypothetical protein GH733_014032 [Mirounga leonina]|nr:hypothetical protein GH733_014032 [Mirounga leonina]
MVAQIKAHVASLEGIAPVDQVVLLAGTPLEDEATLGQCGVEALTTLEVASRMLGGKVHGSLARAGLPRWPNRRKRRQAEPSGGCSTTSTLSTLCPLLARRAPMPTLKRTPGKSKAIMEFELTPPFHQIKLEKSLTILGPTVEDGSENSMN